MSWITIKRWVRAACLYLDPTDNYGQPKLYSVLTRDYNARGKDVRALNFDFKFSSSADKFDNRGVQTAAGTNIGLQTVLSTGIAYYHRGGYWNDAAMPNRRDILSRKAIRDEIALRVAVDSSFPEQPLRAVGDTVRLSSPAMASDFEVILNPGPASRLDVGRTIAARDALASADDALGVAAIDNGISAARERYLNAGGLGILVGDGRLPHPGPEQIIETYYSLAVLESAQLSFDINGSTTLPTTATAGRYRSLQCGCTRNFRLAHRRKIGAQ